MSAHRAAGGVVLRVLRWLVLCAALVALGAAGGMAQQSGLPQETKEQRDRRMAWWREAKFGMFIHWGIYSIPAGEWKGKRIPGIGEWIMHRAQIPVEEYEQLAKQFNPTKFDAKEWVRIAKSAGMKYIVITSKHHDGFCMFDSKLTTYDIVDATPFKRDVLKELADECHNQGIKICWYHSILDWHHPDYLPRRKWDKRPTEGANFERYLSYMKGQLRELLTNYGEIGVLWFDGGWEHSAEELHSEEIVAMVRKLQPNIIINNRARIPQDFDTPEQRIPATGIPGRDWETCMTMNNTWGYKYYDNNWKSVEDLIHKLVDIASKGGNFLLNVGPTSEGKIPEPSVERLLAMGRWMRANGSSIYGTKASPFRSLPFDGRCTRKERRLYLHVFTWPDKPIVLERLKSRVIGARLLATKMALKFTQEGDKLTIYLPPEPPDPIDSVIVLRLAEPVAVDYSIHPAADGTITLLASEAAIHGTAAKFETKYDKLGNIGFWTNPEDWVSWEVSVRKLQRYEVVVFQACPPAESIYVVEVDGKRLLAKVKKTKDWGTFVPVTVGRVTLVPGKHTVAVHPVRLAANALMNLQQVVFKPIP